MAVEIFERISEQKKKTKETPIVIAEETLFFYFDFITEIGDIVKEEDGALQKFMRNLVRYSNGNTRAIPEVIPKKSL